MIPYPHIPPEIISIGPIRWYGMMYLLGFGFSYWLMKWLTSRRDTRFKGSLILDFFAYAALGIVVGGRLGYILVYNLSYYVSSPLEAFAIWHGGLSFHGGFVGVVFWSFVGLYGLFRFLVEFTREPDPQLGFILGPFSMGQFLSLPMFLLGGWMTWRRWKHVQAEP